MYVCMYIYIFIYLYIYSYVCIPIDKHHCVEAVHELVLGFV